MKAFLLNAGPLSEDSLVQRWVLLPKKERTCFFVDGIQLRFRVEYDFRLKWLSQQKEDLLLAMRANANFEPRLQSMMALSSQPLFLNPNFIINMLDDFSA